MAQTKRLDTTSSILSSCHHVPIKVKPSGSWNSAVSVDCYYCSVCNSELDRLGNKYNWWSEHGGEVIWTIIVLAILIFFGIANHWRDTNDNINPYMNYCDKYGC